MLKRSTIFGYGLMSYFAFFFSFCYFIAFVGNVWVPKGIDATATMPFWQALIIDTSLILLFVVPHSIMARQGFKRWLARFLPQSVERSTFVLVSSIMLTTLMVFWQPLGGNVWHIENIGVVIALYSIYAAGAGLIFLSSFVINHFDLFGLRQVWLAFINKPYTDLRFSIPFLYRLTRHPLYLGFIIMMWSAPVMSVTHLVLAVLMTTYIVIAVQFEERDLVKIFGDKYREYQQRVPMLIPGTKIKSGSRSTQTINAN